MAAPPRLGATLLLLLLLRAPPPGWGNEGGALGLCKCQRLMRAPGGRLQDLADKVKGYQACGGHLVRFELPRIQICGLASADWVTELRGLWEKKEAGRIDARQGGGVLAPNPPNAPLPPNAYPPMPSTARPLEPHGSTDGPPPKPPAAPEPHGQPHGAPRTLRRTPGATRTHGQTPRSPRTLRQTVGTARTHGQPHG
ncbi:C-X-C motif chemokine 16-like isoform X1 [Gopherus evgoodei]|uniref:C-X-C motif chemokine 16-like isoform X1 n=1 Tax=Gopherus evgoodei TaxID=1825980 RepID=UPI0011CEE4CC|nr:C-X-C motif chemokine 16-like isoform X1 [Gopherus evgoodei]